jgi:hypothetical protein
MPDDSYAAAGAAGGSTATYAGHPAPERGRVSVRALMFGVFGAPAAWSVQTLVDLALTSHACFPHLEPLAEPTLGGLRGVVFAVSIAALVVSVAATVVAWQAWSRTRHERQQSSGRGREHTRGSAAVETGEGRTRFMALAGLLTSGTFVVASITHLASVFLVSPCGM